MLLNVVSGDKIQVSLFILTHFTNRSTSPARGLHYCNLPHQSSILKILLTNMRNDECGPHWPLLVPSFCYHQVHVEANWTDVILTDFSTVNILAILDEKVKASSLTSLPPQLQLGTVSLFP